MNEEEAIAYAEQATIEIKNRIYKLNEEDAKDVLLYIVARWAEANSPSHGSPKFLIDAERKNANDILTEAIETICPENL